MSADRRAHPRHSVTQQAQFSNDTHAPQACVIENFCQSGLLVSFDYQEGDLLHSAQDPIQAGDNLVVEFTLTNGTAFKLNSTVARVLDSAMGLLVNEHNPQAIQALFQAASGGLSPVAGQSTKPSQNQAKAQQQCRDIVAGWLTTHSGNLSTKVIDGLMVQASQASNNAEEHLLFDLVKKLQAKPEALGNRLKNSTLKLIDNWILGKPNHFSSDQQKQDKTELSLVSKDVFEHWLVAQILINKASQQQAEALYTVEANLSAISAYPLTDKNNPMGPAAMGQGFYEAIQPLKLDKTITQIFFDVFDEEILQQLPGLYESLGEAMAAAGIDAADAKNRIVKSPDEPKTEPKAEQPAPIQHPASVSPIDPASVSSEHSASNAARVYNRFHSQQVQAQQALSAVQQLLGLQQNIAGQSLSSSQALSGKVVDSNTMLDALNNMQFKIAEGDQTLSEQPLSDKISSLLNEQDGALSEQDTMAVGLTENFVNSMLRQNTLADAVKPTIKQLEIPLLKIVRQDDRFFEDENHPARQVLNRLGDLGMKGGAMNKAQQRSIEHLINRLTSDFDQDLNVFDDVLKGLDELKGKQTEAVKRNTKRVVEACEGIQSVDNAKQHVAELLDTQLGGKELPETVIELIDRCWRELLIFVLLRDGKGSTQWKSYAKVVEMLGELTPDRYRSEEIGKRLPGLLKIIETGLQDASASSNTAILDKLKNHLASDTDESDLQFVIFPKGVELEQDFQTNIDAKLLEDKAFSRWLKRAKRMKVGDWVEQQEGLEAMPMRLAWIADEYAKLAFVNHHGMKVVELTLEEVASSLQAGSIWHIAGDDVPFVDQTIDHMIQDIYCQMDSQNKHDELTGCCNRKEFDRRLQQALHNCKRAQNKHTVCFLDLDQFKVINSTCGMTAGDEMLKQIADIISSQLPDGATLARFGGDEFGVIMENCYEAKGREVAQTLLKSIQSFRFVHEEKTFTVGTSIGLVVVDEEWPDTNTVTHCADSALISAKEGGRNRVHVYEANDKDQKERARVMEKVTRLNKALDEERLQLRCQKIQPIDPNSGVKSHYEILLSVEDEQGLYVAPGDFIHAAERYNRMQAVDRWVIRQVFQWMAENKAYMASVGGFTINLSGHSLNDESLLTYVFDQLVDFDVPRGKVCFEITETTAVASLAAAADFISEMKTLGFRFALDDFGSGLASYRYLKNLPVDYVKIDGSFVKDIVENISDFAMVKSINELGHMMGKKTVAEYVENKAILDKLGEIGVDYAQGYYIEKPRLLSEIVSQAAA